MNFFEHQALARRNSRVLVLLFLAATAAVVIAVDLALAVLWIFSEGHAGPAGGVDLRAVPATVWVWGAILTTGLVFLISLVNVLRLAGGGEAVAEMAGARRVDPGTGDPLERRLVNVVEEMAIAAGMRVPAVYVMDEETGINAFAAGWSVSNAVVAVTRGTLERLTRDELQGVIGHEFSHILNGDMRLNVRMIGVLAGISAIGSLGRFMARSGRHGRHGSNGIAAAGVLLWIIGAVGLLFAGLIKAAISRQREFLADASSVQFTRNPEGIAGALDQIREYTALVSNRYAEEMSHLYFGAAVAGLFDTHPPLPERIRRVYPGFQAVDYRSRRLAMAARPIEPGQGESRWRSAATPLPWPHAPAASAALVGTLDATQVGEAAALIASLSADLATGVRTVEGAQAVAVALLLAPEDDAAVAMQMQAIETAGSAALARHVAPLANSARGLDPSRRLPVLDLALFALRAAPDATRRELLRALEAVVHADRHVSLHEYAALALARHQLTGSRRARPGRPRELAALRAEALTVLALVARAGAGGPSLEADAGKAAFFRGVAETDLAVAGFPAPQVIELTAVDRALANLRDLSPGAKETFIRALYATVTHDGTIRVAEAELLRLVCGVLECPVPMLEGF